MYYKVCGEYCELSVKTETIKNRIYEKHITTNYIVLISNFFRSINKPLRLLDI